MRCRPARRRSGHAPCPACRASGGSSRRQERQTSAKRMKPPDGRLTTAARRCFHRGSTIGDHRRPGPWAARPRGPAPQTSVRPGEPVHAGVRHRRVNGVFHLTAPIARSSRRGWGPGAGSRAGAWRAGRESRYPTHGPGRAPGPRSARTMATTRPGGRPDRQHCRALGVWTVTAMAVTGEPVPRSRSSAGRRAVGVPGRGRRRRGGAVPLCRRSAAGSLAEPAMSSNDGTAGAPLRPACRAAGHRVPGRGRRRRGGAVPLCRRSAAGPSEARAGGAVGPGGARPLPRRTHPARTGRTPSRYSLLTWGNTHRHATGKARAR